jgi:hypothetical protein
MNPDDIKIGQWYLELQKEDSDGFPIKSNYFKIQDILDCRRKEKSRIWFEKMDFLLRVYNGRI